MIISYMYYKMSVEGPHVPEDDDTVRVQTQTSVVNSEPIPIQHNSTTYKPDIQIDL